MGSAIRDVEDFIEKMRNQDIMILYERARSISVDKDNKEPLSQALASSITSYEMLGKGAFLSERENLANLCIGYINDAYTQGVIEENKEKLQRQVEELQKQISKIATDYEVLLSENNELKREREAANEGISTLTISVENLTDENKELKKELNRVNKG
jgi:chromosome segregation ATPase